jgi:transposase-like protein
LESHLGGTSFRTLGLRYHLHASTIYRKCASLLETFPHCADLTRDFCTSFCGILLVDGKFLATKNYERKLPVVYGIDYLTHDIPTFTLSMAENYQTCLSFFKSLRLLNYPLQAVVCDDNQNIYQACQNVYPRAVVQLCHNHYKESIRKALGVRTDPTYVPFVREIEMLFVKRRSKEEFNQVAGRILRRYQSDSRCFNILLDIQKRLPLLLAYTASKSIPRTTNLIECFNSHLEGRLKTIKGFESFTHADNWLNAYFIRRRLKPFTDCEKKFKHLNGKCSLEMTVKNKNEISELLRLFR